MIKKSEDILIKDTRFHLPGNKSLLKEESHFEVVPVDVPESSVERPEKTEVELFGQEKAAYSKKRRLLRINQAGRYPAQHLTGVGNMISNCSRTAKYI